MLYNAYVFVAQRWVQAFLTGIFGTLVATTNGLERQHQKLKYSYLHDTANGSVSDLLTVIVRSFVPACRRRYSCCYSCILPPLSLSALPMYTLRNYCGFYNPVWAPCFNDECNVGYVYSIYHGQRELCLILKQSWQCNSGTHLICMLHNHVSTLFLHTVGGRTMVALCPQSCLIL